MENYITVIGGANIDIIGSPFTGLNFKDSNPGNIILALGGVARNIAENLSRLGIELELITVLGQDSHAHEIQNSCEKLNISLNHTLIVPNESSSSYICINNQAGEMQLAISDMNIYKYISPDYLNEKLAIINGGQACVLDTNIPLNSLEFIMDNVEVPIFLDTVSVEKARKIKNSIHNIHTLKPNILEAETLSNMKIRDRKDLERASEVIIKKGVKNVFVSLGSEGVYYTNGSEKGEIPILESKAINTTGAGDSFLAALVWAYLQGFGIGRSAIAGIAAASITVRSKSTVSEEMSVLNIENILNNMEVKNE
ncbi:MAG: PfkB family carbohydrate kinase [Tissierellaceae bacterium]